MHTISHKLLDSILKDGVSVTPEKQQEFIEDMNTAIDKKQVYTIRRKDGQAIGFMTFFPQHDGTVQVNNLFIYSKYRNRFSLLEARRFMRNRCKDMKFCWSSRKRQKLCYVK